MEERDIVNVREIEETEWSNDTSCMSAHEDGSAACSGSADKVLSVVYENEPEKTFFSCLCNDCTAEYTKRWDRAQIYGE